jgi:hypothetical protein
MRTFRINEKIEIVCVSEKTRNGFRHLATLLFNGSEVDKAKCCYLNRTWERYEFQSVMSNLIEKSKALSEDEKQICRKFIEGDRTDWSDFKATSMVAKLGDLFCESKKEKNDWKERMLKAGFGDKGLIMPDDWDTLDEDTKQARLNAVIAVMSNVGDKK